MNWPFRWNADNIDHLAEHGVSPQEAQQVMRNARPPYPRAIQDGKFVVCGQTHEGVYLQVIFIFSPPGVVYVIHARPLNEREKIRFRRQKR
jgi:uncharacterized DUF497 family protein